jgi:tetratricopeptide (TPR) repeat protein
MKTERRHELQTNSLADHLGKWIVVVKPYASIVGIAVAGVLIVTVAWQYIAAKAAANDGQAWDEFSTASRELAIASQLSATSSDHADDPKMRAAITGLELVTTDNEGQPVAYWTDFMLGNHYQTIGSRMLFYDREKAGESLKKAVTHFKEATAAEQEDLKQRAYFGLAQAYECQGDLDNATKTYDDLVKDFPDGPYSDTARSYSERLQKPATRTFYVNYMKQDPDALRKEEDDKPVGRVLGPDSFKIPGVDFGGSSKDPLESGPFIPKIVVPTDDSAAPDDAGDAAELPAEPSDETPKDFAPTKTEPSKAEPAKTEAAVEDSTDAPAKKPGE